jgi:IclR family KDG regulon transcriptional repressor
MEIVESVTKAIKILECFDKDNPEISLSEISRDLVLPKTTTFRLINTLEYNGYLEFNQLTKKYKLGKKFALIAANYLKNIDIRKVALPIIERIRDLTGETTTLNILQDDQRIIIDYFLGKGEIIYRPELGRHNPLYAGASSKVILSFLNDEKIEKLLHSTELKAFTENTVTSISEIRDQIKLIRLQGYAMSISEREQSIVAVSAPINNYQGIAGSITIGFPANRLSSKNIDELVRLIKEGAEEISIKLGGV